MSTKRSFFSKYVAEIVLFFLCIHAFLPILSPILFNFNSESPVAIGIQEIYAHFCHQRVDRSLFLFGDSPDSKYFYTVEELQNLRYLPLKDSGYHFGLPYWGNSEVGYKVAFCIRDVALYSSLVLFGFILVFSMNVYKKIPKFHWLVIVVLVLPMALDGSFQILNSIFQFPWVPDEYMESILKRIVTGILFGMGIAMLIFTNLKDASDSGYNSCEDN